MPTPRAYDDLYRQYEELRWAAFQLVNAMTAEEEKSLGKLHDAVWGKVGDCDGPPPWLVLQSGENQSCPPEAP